MASEIIFQHWNSSIQRGGSVMFQVPVTFAYNFNGITEALRANIMQEFAANGAKHLVLTCSLISQIMADANLPGKLHKEMNNAGLTFVDAHAPFQGVYDPIYPDAAAAFALMSAFSVKLCPSSTISP